MLSDYLKTTKTANVGLSSYKPISAKPDLKSSQGLYDLAVRSGLQKDADRLLKQQSGEEMKKIFSGGFISDIFDVLNAFQYGVVGTLKGDGFMQGVKSRSSFSDKDALGDKGLPGVIAGIALDIAVDPLTYIAPATIAKKIPFLSKIGKAVKETAFGRLVPKTIKTGAGEKAIQQLEGGSRLGKYTAEKFVWMFGADPVFKRAWERGLVNTAISESNIVPLVKTFSKIDQKIAGKALKSLGATVKGGVQRTARLTDTELKKVLSGKSYEIMKKGNDTINDLGKQLVDLGVLDKKVFEESFEEHI
ncbi:MAG: hypothetical protein ACTSUF_06180, partial [Candidatus Heimdallarchaeaceae archaeon]